MRRVLFIAYYFPPSVDAGAKRAEGFFRHLPAHGYAPLVLTVKNGNYSTVPGALEEERPDVIRVRERRRLLGRQGPAGAPPTLPRREGWGKRISKRLFRELFYIPDGFRGFYHPAVEAALGIIARERVDLVFTTSSPWTSLRLGHHVGLRTRIPWVADFRDLWVENHFGYPHSSARRLLDSFLQRRWLAPARRITTASDGFKARLEAAGYRPVDCIPNGYLEIPVATPAATEDPNTLRLCHTGTLYERPGHTVLPLFGAVAQLRELQPSVFHALRLDFYGTVNADFAEQLDRLALHEVVRYHGTVTRDDAVRAQCGSDALLLFMPDTREQEDAVYTKTYEYMAARKPLIAVAPEAGENARVLAAAGMGRVFSAHETEEMAAYLMELAATKKRLGRLPPQGDPTVIANYSYRALAGRLARVFDAALDSGPAA